MAHCDWWFNVLPCRGAVDGVCSPHCDITILPLVVHMLHTNKSVDLLDKLSGPTDYLNSLVNYVACHLLG